MPSPRKKTSLIIHVLRQTAREENRYCIFGKQSRKHFCCCMYYEKKKSMEKNINKNKTQFRLLPASSQPASSRSLWPHSLLILRERASFQCSLRVSSSYVATARRSCSRSRSTQFYAARHFQREKGFLRRHS